MSSQRGYSLITEPNILKLPKLNSTVSQQEKPYIKCPKKEHLINSPMYKRFLPIPLYPSSTQKLQKKRLMIESCLIDRTYDDIKERALQNKMQNSLNDNRSMHSQIFPPIGQNRALVSKDAPFEYYREYKKLGKLLDKSNFQKENKYESLFLPVLQKTEKLNILPMTMGLVKFQGDSNILNANNYNLGDKYIIAMSSGLKKAKIIEKFYLSSNRITNKGFSQLANCLNLEVNTLDVSYNMISELNDKMMELIGHPEGRLQRLNLQNNQVKKKEVIYSLVESISISKHLRVLNLRSNGITNDCAHCLCDLIDADTHLEELYLGKNFITAKSGTRIFTNLAKNKNLKLLDYSLNNLGEDEKNQCAKAIATCLSKNKTLLHVDLSSNNFSEDASKLISQGLEPNKKIYGFHFDGNHGYIDSRGFLIIQQKQLTSLHSLVETKIDSYNITSKRTNSTTCPKLFKNVCWICEGWYEQQFRFTVPDDFSEQKKLVYLHFDFQLFAPRLINIQDKNVRYKTMVPPTKFKYFFTFDGKLFTDKNAKTASYDLPQTFTYQMNHRPTQFSVKEVSYKPKSAPKKIVNDLQEIIIITLPRNTDLVTKKAKEKWTYEKSLWAKEWKLDTDDVLKKCFEKDWKCSKIMNLVKNQQDQDKVKEKLYKNYKAIKLAYKYFASWSPFGDVWAVSNNAWTQFCQQAKIINKETPLKITDLTFITTNSISGADHKSNPLVPERGLVRFQFMECLVRLSQEKYKKLGLTENFSDSIDLMIKDCLLPLTNTLSHQKWRQKKYFTEQNDALIKKYRSIFNYIYRKNSKMNVKPGEKPFMCLSEFKTILERANLAGTMLLQRDIFVSFNLSMMTQVDELESQRFIRMTQIEYIEAVARCSSILPKNCTLSSDKKDDGQFKFEWLINELKKTNCNQDIKTQFPDEGSIFDKNEDD